MSLNKIAFQVTQQGSKNPYTQIGYVTNSRRFGLDSTLTDSAYRILSILKGMANWRNYSYSVPWGRVKYEIQNGSGYFSQLKLAETLGKCPKTIHRALMELSFAGHIEFTGDEYGTRFRLLVKDRQEKRGGVGHSAVQLNSRSSFLYNSSYKQRPLTNRNTQKKALKIGGYLENGDPVYFSG